MDWPIALIAELAARRCIIFLGAGASAGCIAADRRTQPPLWHDFLLTLKGAMPAGAHHNAVENLIQERKFLDAAEVIVARVAAADLTRIVRETFVQPHFEQSPIHESILMMDPKVAVTTNYDDIYDSYCRTGIARDGYNVCRYYDNHLVNDLRSPVRLVVKAHGCVSDPSKIVLTRSQYFRERQLHGQFYNVLDALFLTNTLLFVGYSMSDPDIQLVLENANIAAPSTHRHYALIEDAMHPDIEEAMASAYNIHFIKYPLGNYGEAEAGLKELADAVQNFRVSNLS